jgi:dihydroxyacetone kinase-like protein
MKTQLTREDALPLAESIAASLEAANEAITALDAEMGDGDLGVTCRLGMRAVLEAVPGVADPGLDAVLLKAGMSFNAAGASTFGALVASGAMRAAKLAKDEGLQAWDLPALAAGLRAAAGGIEQRGKAQRGEKTLLDALWPAIEALEAAAAQGKPLPEALAAAAQAAAAGAEATRPLKSKFGRAAWLQDKTVGVQDPGATVIATVMASLAEYVA